MDTLDQMMAWESGELDADGTAALFQELVDSGMAWKLQGAYGRTAAALIRAGVANAALSAHDHEQARLLVVTDTHGNIRTREDKDNGN